MRRIVPGFAAALSALLLAACAQPRTELPEVHPPRATVEYAADTLFGEVLTDNYRWLEDRDSTDVVQYLEAENAYTEAMTAEMKAIEDTLFDEIVARIKETDVSVPYREGGYYYFHRTEEGKDYRIYCRTSATDPGAPAEVILDQNALAEGHDFCDVGTRRISPDGRYLAFTEDTTGREIFYLRIKDLTTGEMLPETIPGVDYSLAWANDSRTLFYTTMDETLRPNKVFRHVLGTEPENDVEVFHEPDGRFYVDVFRSKDDRYLIIDQTGKITSEAWYLDADDPTAEPTLLARRREGVEYYVDHAGDAFVILTNDNALNFRVVAAPDSATGPENWTDVVPHRDDALIDGFEVFKDFVATVEINTAVRRLHIQPFDGSEGHDVKFDEPMYAVELGDNQVFDTDSVRIEFYSYTTPNTIYDYNMDTRSLVMRKRDEVGGGFYPSNYATELIMAPSRDGKQIPVSIVYRRDVDPRGDNPLVLRGYGAYGYTSRPWFSYAVPSLLDRGVVYADAHVRGSSARGRQWYLDGKFLHKRNTFNDYIDVAQFLVDSGYTAPDRLIAVGGSAGGLLMGAVANDRPDLFRGIVMHVPFVDIMNTMLDASLPLTEAEYDEWGNPNEENYFRYMLSYSPYDNIRAQGYPSMLVTAGLNDPRVQYWEPAKWVAKLRATKTDDNLLLLKTDMGAGHLGASGRYGWYRETAFYYAFVLDVLGIRN